MKILVLRIYNSTDAYDIMKEHHTTYDNSIFIRGIADLETEWKYDAETRILDIREPECYVPGVLNKTVKALEISRDLFDFDVLVRSNMSTVINYAQLEQTLSKHSYTYIYGGNMNVLNWIDDANGITEDKLNDIRFTHYASGTSIVMSKNVCDFIIDNQQLLDRSLIDDVAIGVMLKNVFPFNFMSQYTEIISENIHNIDINTLFYRHKTDNRMKDAEYIAQTYLALNKDTPISL
jgi:hypothetical protein